MCVRGMTVPDRMEWNGMEWNGMDGMMELVRTNVRKSNNSSAACSQNANAIRP